MKQIGDFLGLMFVSLLLLWIGGLIFSSNKCVRVYRSAWPVTFTMSVVESVSQYWTTDETKLEMLIWKANGAVRMQTIFERTVYGELNKCTK